MYIYQRINLDGSTWRSRSISTEKLFDEEVYLNKTIPASAVTFTNEPREGDYEELCNRLSGKVKTYRLP
ncbi:hypothetical protein [Thalassobacillus pellis]|uniref:hypothetical protein n=1 Tax=Thalassobacillus pellis TaxID=748008 RepID=UPI001961B503|nr:hypothetical protein [Thalassobacillus pellis]MBM7554416.1 hypothetical protein [Thalassobacillus pellis]